LNGHKRGTPKQKGRGGEIYQGGLSFDELYVIVKGVGEGVVGDLKKEGRFRGS